MLERPLDLPCGARLGNRIAKAAMTEGLADPLDRASESLCTLYERWSGGGAGLHITGNVMVDRRFLERPGNVVVDGPGGDDALRRWAAAGTRGGNHLWMQVSHPGRQCHRGSGHQPLSPSGVPLKLGPSFARPRAMTGEEIEDAIARYAAVAGRAREAGFTGVQVHAAHGYLISQFLSPRVNTRSDEWGGSLGRRARFLRDVVAAVRETVGDDFPVAVKLNSSDFQKGGFSDSDCRQVARWLDGDGIDLLEISGGTYEQPQLLGHDGLRDSAAPPKRDSTRRREAYFLDYARRIKEAVQVPLMVTGGFRSAAAMEAALSEGEADLIGLARPLCVEVDLPRRLLEDVNTVAPRWEDRLVLGRGVLGPASPLFLVQLVNIQGEVAWFYRQLLRLARGESPDPELGLLRALGAHLRDEWRSLKRRNRATRAAGSP